jgi:circadian clock protein KaiC
VKSGLVEIMWQSPLDAIADALAERVIAAVREGRVRRLFIDGLGGFKDALVYVERARRFLGALCNELRSLGVVTLLSDQTPHLSELEFPEHGLTALLDTVIGLRHVERDSRTHKLVSLLKMREGGGDPSPRQFSIDERGFTVSTVSASGTLAPSVRSRKRVVPPNTSRPSAKKSTKRRPR